MAKVSILIPARNERFLIPTIDHVLLNAHGDIEVIVSLDGYWPDERLPDDPRLRVLHRGNAQGMRPGINAMARMARGDYLMKLDAHCMVAGGFDLALQAECDENWIVVPRRYALDPEGWRIDDSNSKYPVDYHYLSYPWERPEDGKVGLHGTVWTARRAERAHLDFDDEMSSQGSCWFMDRRHWLRLGEMDSFHYGNFIHEFQELGLKTWLGGGAVKINKRTWYAHLYKGRRYGRMYSMGENGHKAAMKWCQQYWMNDQWPQATRTMRWLVEKFGPVPGWPADLDVAFARARQDRAEQDLLS